MPTTQLQKRATKLIGSLGTQVVGRCNEAVASRDDGACASEPRWNRSLQSGCGIVAVHDLGTKSAKFLQITQQSAGQRSFAEDEDRDSFLNEPFAQRAEDAVGDDRDVVAVLSLEAAELGDEGLRATHLKTVDDVNDLHAVCDVGFTRKEEPVSNLHDLRGRANPQRDRGGILREYRTSARSLFARTAKGFEVFSSVCDPTNFFRRSCSV